MHLTPHSDTTQAHHPPRPVSIAVSIARQEATYQLPVLEYRTPRVTKHSDTTQAKHKQHKSEYGRTSIHPLPGTTSRIACEVRKSKEDEQADYISDD